MLTLNLVSQEQKNEIKLKNIYAIIKKIGLSLTAAAVFFSVILLSAKFILEKNYAQVLEQTALVADADGSYAAKIKDINEKINSAQKIQNEYIPWSLVLAEITSLTPAGVAYSGLKAGKDGAKTSLTGAALTRQDLLALKENLENSKLFLKIDSPFGDILQKENINFTVNLDLNMNEIKNIKND